MVLLNASFSSGARRLASPAFSSREVIIAETLGTLTVCSWDPDFGKDGDALIGEC